MLNDGHCHLYTEVAKSMNIQIYPFLMVDLYGYDNNGQN